MKDIEHLTLRDMIENISLYVGLPDGLSQLPVPEYIKIRRKRLTVPKDLDEFTKAICYGQRLFLVRKEDNDFGLIIRVMDGYFYSLVTGKYWDEDRALLFGKYILPLKVKDLYPSAMRLETLISEMITKEQKLLYREPSKLEKAAGIEKLNIFGDLVSLDFLRDVMKCTVPEVLLTPYNECLVRFMIAKETAEYQERYFELMKEINKSKFIK